MNIPNKTNIALMPLQIAKERLPYVVIKILNGAEVIFNYENKKDVVCVRFDDSDEFLNVSDFTNCKLIADKIYKTYILPNNIVTSYSTLKRTMELHRRAFEEVCHIYGDKFNGKHKVIFIKGDDSACGYWRMVLPARYLSEEKYFLDVSTARVIFEYLLEYDTIFIQRICDWESYYVIQKLKKSGKKIVYDVDDNLFEIPDYHPSYRYYGNDAREAAASIMLIVDKICVTTQRLADALVRIVGEEIKSKIHIIPNAIDYDTFGDVKHKMDEKEPFRIFWAGGCSHEQDFTTCYDAIDDLFKNNSNMKITLLGYMPKIIINNQKEWWQGKIEYVEYANTETYFNILRRIKADVGICPLIASDFNCCKSNIKWIEYSMANLPVIASNVPPYSDSIENNATGILVNTKEEWHVAIKDIFDSRYSDKWANLTKNARKTIKSKFNIDTVSESWNKFLS